MDQTLLSQIFWMFLAGTGIALFLLVTSAVISTVLAVVLVVLDIYGPRPVRVVIRIYSWLAQTIPPLILLFLAFYGFTSYGIMLSPIVSAIIAFTVFATAYNFEILRASFEAVPKGQFEAAQALGVPLSATLRRIVLPQMLPIAAVPYIGRATVLLKETSLASAISVPEIMNVTGGLIYSGMSPLVLIGLAAFIYVVINFAMIGLEDRLARVLHTRNTASQLQI
jgi:His/Glu/Gln/Arg/opine family amino acid ABC transporter permease subunit